MTLTTHAITGAAIATLFPNNPAAAFSLAFVSHFALDLIPHWDYSISSEAIETKEREKFKIDRKLFYDFLKIGTDGILGVTISFILFYKTGLFLPLFLGIVGGMLPDFLQFLFIFFKSKPLEILCRIQTLKSNHLLKNKQLRIWGITTQLAIILTIILYFKFLI